MIVFNKKVTSNSKSVFKINYFGINSTSLFYFIITFYISVLPFCNLQSQEIIQLLNANWKFSEAGKNDWLPATVPGTVHTDLLTNKEFLTLLLEQTNQKYNGLKVNNGITQLHSM